MPLSDEVYVEMRLSGPLDKVCPLCGKDLVPGYNKDNTMFCPGPEEHYSHHTQEAPAPAVEPKDNSLPPCCDCGIDESSCPSERLTCGPDDRPPAADPNVDALLAAKVFKEAVEANLGQAAVPKEGFPRPAVEYPCETGPDHHGYCTVAPLSRHPTLCQMAIDRHCCPADPDARADDYIKAQKEEEGL